MSISLLSLAGLYAPSKAKATKLTSEVAFVFAFVSAVKLAFTTCPVAPPAPA